MVSSTSALQARRNGVGSLGSSSLPTLRKWRGGKLGWQGGKLHRNDLSVFHEGAEIFLKLTCKGECVVELLDEVWDVSLMVGTAQGCREKSSPVHPHALTRTLSALKQRKKIFRARISIGRLILIKTRLVRANRWQNTPYIWEIYFSTLTFNSVFPSYSTQLFHDACCSLTISHSQILTISQSH